MSDEPTDFRAEIERIKNVSDMLCTAHAGLRDRYGRRAVVLDLAILGASTWLVALVFVEPHINVSLTPRGFPPEIWVGLLGIVTFFLSIIQIKTDWKGRADSHRLSLRIYASVKRECGYLLASETGCSFKECQCVLARYDLASEVGAGVPENDFLRQKRRHRLKVAISQHLDTHPAASVLLTKIRWWLRDNIVSRGGDRS
jgi:hypothetical protein